MLHLNTAKTIFLTGVTGFVGMAVLEKLLSDQLPEIECVYVLVRASRGDSPATRLQATLKNPVFDCLREKYPDFASKVVVVEGEMSQPGLGLSTDDTARLACSVQTIVHCAASVEFNLPLKEAFDVNTMGVVRLLELADKCSELQGIVHVSTAYVNCNLKNITIEEKVYPMPIGDPMYLIESLPTVDQAALDSLELCVLKEYPNTYTFTKALSEHALVAKSTKWNIAIVRPSIIISALASPTPGWVHGMTAITGVSALIGMGIANCLPAHPHSIVDIIPIDYVAGMVLGAMHVVKDQPGYKVYHATSSNINPLTWEMFRTGVLGGWAQQPPLKKCLAPPALEFYPDLAEFKDKLQLARQRLFSSDAAKLAKKDPAGTKKMLNMALRVEAASQTFVFFANNQFVYKSHNVLQLEAKQPHPPTVGRELLATMDWNEYLADFTKGLRHFILEKKVPEPVPVEQPAAETICAN